MKHFYAAFSGGVRWVVVLWGCLGLLAGPAKAMEAAPGRAATVGTPSLAEVLNPDGTLRTGAQGSFDAHRFRMHMAPDGRPTFRPAQVAGTGDENWQDNFRLPGTDSPVNVVVQVGTTVYIGGGFTKVGNLVANGIAKWDGTAWSSLGTGTKNGVGTNVYASAGSVYALAVAGNDLYVGGYFRLAGGAAASGMAKWNGTTWSSLGTGTTTGTGSSTSIGVVYALTVAGTSIYAGGEFTGAGGLAVNNIAKWDGATWSSLGTGTANGTSGGVGAVAALGTSVYVGGAFTKAGGITANYVAKWDGTAWSSLGTGTAAGTNGTVLALAVAGSTVYVGGYLTKAGGVAASYVAKWDGATWSTLGTGLNGIVRGLGAGAGTKVNVGGLFVTVGDGSKASFYFGVYDDSPTLLASRGPARPLTGPALTIYPNPAQASFAVSMPGVAGASTMRAELLNTLGQVVRQQVAPLPAAGAVLHFETAGLATGIYTLRLQAGSTSLAGHVFVQ